MVVGRKIWPSQGVAPGEKTLGEGTGQEIDAWENMTSTNAHPETQQSKRLRQRSQAVLRS